MSCSWGGHDPHDVHRRGYIRWDFGGHRTTSQHDPHAPLFSLLFALCLVLALVLALGLAPVLRRTLQFDFF